MPHDYLLADEPTLGLDEQSVASFEKMLSEERSQGKGILLATNDSQLASRSADICIEVMCGTIPAKEVAANAPSMA
jgi:ABC-type Mn2+/Zn2+ transport system ATPase subunit